MRIFLSLAFLAVASVYDLKTREVPNKIWIVFIPFSIIATIVYTLANPNQFYLTLASITITTLIAVVIFYAGLYGGADAKALITLALTHPTQSNSSFILPILPLTAFNNSLVLMVLTLPISLFRNLYWKIKNHQPLFKELDREPTWKKAAALILCIKTSKSKIKPYHIITERIEIKDGETKRTLKIFQKVREEDTIVDNTIPEYAFVAYSLPVLPFLTLGYILTITTGDLILHLTAIVLRS